MVNEEVVSAETQIDSITYAPITQPFDVAWLSGASQGPKPGASQMAMKHA